MKERIISYTRITLTRRTAFILILTFTVLVVFDSTIVDFSTYSGVEATITVNIAIFICLSVIFVATSTILLNSVRGSMSSAKSPPLGLRYFHGVVRGTQIFSIIVIVVLIFQILVLNEYNLVLLRIQTYLSHLAALVFVPALVYLFVGWLTSKRSYPVILYVISLSLVSLNLVVSLMYLDSYLSSSPLPIVTPYPITEYVTNFSGVFSESATAFSESLSPIFDAISLSSFLLMWVATSILLSQYRHRIGRIKFFSLMSISLIYYIFPFQSYFSDAFFSVLPSSPVSFSILYFLIFSATKQAGALLFSLAFWTASLLIRNEEIRKSLLMTSIGIVIVFGSIEIAPLQYHVYPPYGLVTEAFVPLGAYLLFAGIFISVKSISRNAEVRREFYKTAESRLELLRTVGVSQMEKDLESQVKSIEKRINLFETKVESDMEEEDIKETLHDVLNELYYSKGKKEIQK